jgi:glycosyltransferase involved in cell wall biosynthesis
MSPSVPSAASISIIVPSLNDAGLATTLESLALQDYPQLEVVIEERGSIESSLGDTLNRGFARASGEILGYLLPGDALLPGILHRVAAQVDPARDRLVVMGRCLFYGEGLPGACVEFPARYAGHFEYLAIWKRGFNDVPQPAVFWHRLAWERCGGFDRHLQHALDYDLFCRFSRHYSFFAADDFWAKVRIDSGARPAQCSESELLDLSVACSRKYWGSWLAPLRWRCEASYRLYARQGHERARHHARRAEAAVRQGRLAAAFGELAQTLRFSPAMAWKRLLSHWLATGTRLIRGR